MIRLKDLLNEGETKNPLIKRLLVELKPLIADIIEDTKQRYKKEDRVYSEFDAYYTEITLKFDMVKALEKYTQPTDKMSEVKVKNSSKGSFQISCIIERDEVKYPFNTEVIYAGGYNIQKLHFRYLTKTSLPYTGQTAETQKLKAELAKLSKGERLKKDIEILQKNIDYNQNLIDTNSKISDKEIIKIVSADGYGTTPTGGWFASQLKPLNWYELSDEQKERFGSEAAMEKDNKEQTEYSIAWWKKRNIQWPMDTMKTAKLEKVKVEKKLDALANS
jgi:hypothetical protein